MQYNQAWPEQLVLRLDERSLRGFAKVQRGPGELQVFVPYTCPELTKAALAQAATLTRNLGAHITLFAVHLEKQGAAVGSLEKMLAGMAQSAGARADVRIDFAGDPGLGCTQTLPPHSLVVMATKKRWWPTAQMKLAQALARAGHSVALLEV